MAGRKTRRCITRRCAAARTRNRAGRRGLGRCFDFCFRPAEYAVETRLDAYWLQVPDGNRHCALRAMSAPLVAVISLITPFLTSRPTRCTVLAPWLADEVGSELVVCAKLGVSLLIR